jgi:uncharacterized protein YidB (DUF937 family)
MGLLDGILGGTVGAALVTAVNDIIQKNGGLSGLVANFQQRGLGSIVQSWISTGPNQPITPDQVSHGAGPEVISQVAAKLGIPEDELKSKLAEILPTAIDKLTPHGKLPS